MKTTVSIILLNYNGLKFNEDCINSLLKQTFQDFEIIFVDNASTDGSVEVVEEIFQDEINNGKIKIIRNSVNTGFAEGNNIGVKYSNATDYIWLLNNDTKANKDSLEQLVNTIKSNLNIGAVGSMVLDIGKESFILDNLRDGKKFISNFFGETSIVDASINEIKTGIYEVPSISGCSFLYNKELIDKPFPEFYFAYSEDVFLSFYILYLGKKIIYNTNSIIIHYGGGAKNSNKKLSEFSLFHGNKNQIINFLVFFSFKTKIKLLLPFLLHFFFSIFYNNIFLRSKIKIKSLIWIIINYNKIINLQKFLKNRKIIPEKQFYDLLSRDILEEKLLGTDLHFKRKIVYLINKIVGYYLNIL